jgi:thiol:disulfide interchange protein DsbD
LCLPPCCLAQQNKLSVSPPDAVVVKRGGTAVEKLRVEVLAGFHVNSDKPKDEFLIPLKLTWTAGPLDATSITYPKPEEVKVGADLLNVLTGSFNIQTEFRSPGTAQPGSATMTGKLRYQACNNEMCFRPATIEVRVPVVIE